MILRAEILKEHSRAGCTRIVKWVGADQQRFDELFGLFLHDEYRVVQRASWPLGECVMAHPHFIKKHWGSLVKNLEKKGLHDAVKRNSVRLLQDMEIPKKYQGAVMGTCFHFLGSPSETIAVKVFSMTVLKNLARLYPEIIPELKFHIETQLPYQSAGFKNRAKKILAALKK